MVAAEEAALQHEDENASNQVGGGFQSQALTRVLLSGGEEPDGGGVACLYRVYP